MQAAQPGAPTGKRKGRKGPKVPAAGPPKPRPVRCGECYNCRNPRLKKGCQRNQDLRSRGIDPASIAVSAENGGSQDSPW